MRRHGWAVTFDTTVSATRICLDLRFSAPHHPPWLRWEQRLDLLMPAGYRRSLFMAAIFPEVTAIAALIASSARQAVTAERRPAHLEHLLDACAQLTLFTSAVADWHVNPVLVDIVVALSLVFVGVVGLQRRPKN
ncbi:hypothetical protein [Micromonospora sp. NPDC050200]|uniref:hypothetical protein n=1 Tax=Micromonospora sp. NPDC050200 TaxID=3155664 RepID=UPI0033EECE3A